MSAFLCFLYSLMLPSFFFLSVFGSRDVGLSP